MPIIADPDKELALPKTGVKPSQVILWLLFPVIFVVGMIVGFVVGVKQGQNSVNNSKNTNQPTSVIPSTIIPNANSRVLTNTVEVNTNSAGSFSNLSNAAKNGDYLKISAQTQANLDAAQQADVNKIADSGENVQDIVRQRDLISLKYSLKAYYSVEGSYPVTSGQAVKIENQGTDPLSVALKDFYGGTFAAKVDPESPTYYYSYQSDGQHFTLTCWLTSKKTAYLVTDAS